MELVEKYYIMSRAVEWDTTFYDSVLLYYSVQ